MDKTKMEEDLLASGWRKIEGFKIIHDELSEGEETFVEDPNDVLTSCTYYQDPTGDIAFEDLTQAYEWAIGNTAEDEQEGG